MGIYRWWYCMVYIKAGTVCFVNIVYGLVVHAAHYF